jgi:hypothetical protein
MISSVTASSLPCESRTRVSVPLSPDAVGVLLAVRGGQVAASVTRCLGPIKRGGVTVSGWQNIYVATTECRDIFFLDATLLKSGANAQGSALMAAVGALGTSFVAPGIVEGRTSFGPSRRDGPAVAAPFGYVADYCCLKYTGAAFTVS